jgi:hypothetical protein
MIMKAIIICLLLSACLLQAAVGPSGGGTVIPGGSTNVALLNGTNAFTGTNTLNMASLKASGSFSVVLLATNLNWLGDVTGSASPPSPWADAAQVASFTMPALIGDHGLLRITLRRQLSNSVAASVYPLFYGGASDGFLGALGGTGTSAVTNYTANQVLFAAYGSATNQLVNANGAQSATWTTAASVLDTSTNWTLRMGLSHSSGAGVTSTNIGLKTLIVEWVFGP